MDSRIVLLFKLWLTLLYFLPSLLFAYPAPAIKNDPAKATETLNDLKKSIKKIESSLHAKQKQESEISLALKDIEKRMGHNAEKLRSIRLAISDKQTELNHLEKKADTLSYKYHKEQIALAEQLTARFKTFKKENLQLFFGQHDLTKVMRAKHYYQYFNQSRKAYVESLALASTEISNAQTHLLNEQHRLKELEQARLKEEELLSHDKDARQLILTTINSTLSAHKANLSDLKQQEKVLTELTHSLQKNITKFSLPDPNQPFAKLKGKLLSPLQGDRYSLKTLARSLEKGKKHFNIAAIEGTEVRAIHEGRVVFADWLRGLGQLLIIDHGNGYMSLYGYNQILYKTPGDSVKMGEKISLVGQSGGQAKPGLYFEIRKDGTPLDPTPWFQ